mmetsp:Transcript_37019/g.66620  ORF Transcript_37019/g.66620 Transcript_37019/m.66620 type:complete len:625 (+) Transcript_37019:65-1939(+)
MRLSLLLIALGTATDVALARSSGRPSSSAPRRSSGGSRSSSSARKNSGGKSKRRDPIDESDDEDPLGFDDEEDDILEDDGAEDYDDYDEEEIAPPRRGASPARRGGAPSRGGPMPPQQRRRPPPTRMDDYDEDEYDEDIPPPSRRGNSRGGRAPPPRGNNKGRGGPPPSRRGGRGAPDGRMVSYNQSRRRGPPPPSTFTRGLSAIRDKMPDPTAVKDSMLSATRAVKDTSSALSSNIYREVKGLTSSELEQVMLKSTRPDETPVKTKHVERLVGVTYQISGKYDIYDAVLRKLWNKMAEKDMRTKLKSVYVLHRFAVDGSPNHQEALKQRLRALRKTKDPKRSSGGRGGTRYFDSKVLIGADNDPENSGYRAFLSRYAHYVLTRAQTFGGIFHEISLAQMPAPAPTSKKGRSKSKGGAAASAKPKNPPLCEEHLKFAQMVLKAGLACTLHDGEDSESTAMCVERVAADLMGLTAAVAVALKRELKSQPISKDSEELVKQWCEFYSEELLPDTKKFCKKVTGKLDAYGLYLPSRMSASLSQELLEKGLKLGAGGEKESAEEEEGEEQSEEEEKLDEKSSEEEEVEKAEEADASLAMSASAATASTQDDEDEYDEYEYDEYDDEYD